MNQIIEHLKQEESKRNLLLTRLFEYLSFPTVSTEQEELRGQLKALMGGPPGDEVKLTSFRLDGRSLYLRDDDMDQSQIGVYSLNGHLAQLELVGLLESNCLTFHTGEKYSL
jgi:hypothetical protein